MSDFTQITGRLFTGAALTDTTAAALTAAGVTAVVDCRAEGGDDQAKLGAAFSLLWDPTEDDGQAKDALWWDKGITFAMDVLSHHGTRLLAHCAAGCNRGPSMCYGIMLACGWDADDALTLIKAKRPAAAVAYADDARRKVPLLGWC